MEAGVITAVVDGIPVDGAAAAGAVASVVEEAAASAALAEALSEADPSVEAVLAAAGRAISGLGTVHATLKAELLFTPQLECP